MESTVVLDSSVLVAGERKRLTTPEVIRKVREAVGDAEPHAPPVSRRVGSPGSDSSCYGINRRNHHQAGAQEAAKGITVPLADLIIEACALELGFAVGTTNGRDFARIPGLSIVHL